MWLFLFNKITYFFSKQWELITAIGTGFVILIFIKKYVENNTITKHERDRLMDAFKRSQEARKAKQDYEAHINSLDRDGVISIMQQNFEFRNTEN